MLSKRDTGHEVAPEAEVQSLDGEVVLLIQLAGQLQVEGGLAGCALHAHLGHRLRPHVWRIEHIPQQSALCMLPAGQATHLSIACRCCCWCYYMIWTPSQTISHPAAHSTVPDSGLQPPHRLCLRQTTAVCSFLHAFSTAFQGCVLLCAACQCTT